MSKYNELFYKIQSGDSIKSARQIVPIILDLINAKSVVDVGCGIGTWLSVFKEHGVDNILGVDGDWVNKEMLFISENDFLEHDLQKKLDISKKFDLVVSLEVAEHLPKDKAEGFVKNLINLGEVILFSAAIPYQGGTGHVNERWQEYWGDLFRKEGYILIDCIRNKVWDNPEVVYWYAQNIFIFAKEDCLKNNDKLMDQFEKSQILSNNLVHPESYLTKVLEINNTYKSIFKELYTRQEYELIIGFKELTNKYVEFYKGRAFKELQEYKKAIDHLKIFIQEEESIRDSLFYDKGFVISACFYVGVSYYELNDNENAKIYFKRCNELADNQHSAAKKYLNKL